MIAIDHIFIFSSQQGKEADGLVDFGLTEGSSRVHTGQGTTNRKFYFDNFFLEILWVHDEKEASATIVKETGLFDRSRFQDNEYSSFGLCVVNTEETDILFEGASLYQPAYFPEGMAIDYVNSPNYPWLFRLPFKGVQKKKDEPRNHQNGIKALTKVIFKVKDYSQGAIFDQISKSSNIQFEPAENNELILVFDEGKQCKSFTNDDLFLKINF